MLKKGGEVQNLAIQKIWRKTEAKSQRVIRRGRGSDEDRQDVRQEATMLLYLAIQRERFRGKTDAELIAFYNQTFLFVWMDRVRKRDQMPMNVLEEYSGPIDHSIEEILIQLEIETKAKRKLEECLKKLDEKGVKIIKWRYFEVPPFSWEEIAQRLAYNTAQTAQNKGGKGMKQLRICMGG